MWPPTKWVVNLAAIHDFSIEERLQEVFPLQIGGIYKLCEWEIWCSHILRISHYIDVLPRCRMERATRHEIVREMAFEGSWTRDLLQIHLRVITNTFRPSYQRWQPLAFQNSIAPDESDYLHSPSGPRFRKSIYPHHLDTAESSSVYQPVSESQRKALTSYQS